MASDGEVPFLPLHIVEQILLTSDAPTLFRCAFVCHDWHRLITAPSFISRCLHRSSNQILLVKVFCRTKRCRLVGGEPKFLHAHPYCRASFSIHRDNDLFDLLHTIQTPPTQEFKGTRLIGISNGLICVSTVKPYKFMLWNPTIRKYIWLPDPSLITCDDNLRNEWVDKSKIPKAFGFGFSDSINDFKVVNFFLGSFSDDSVDDSVWIFSYNTWSWKRLICTIHSLDFDFQDSICLNNVLHWPFSLMEDEEEFIITFDLTHEEVGQISLPNALVSDNGSNCIATIGDSLAVIRFQHLYDVDTHERLTCTFSVWIMKEYKNHESWTKLYSFTTTEQICPLRTLGMRKNGDAILQMTEKTQICLFNPMTSTYALVGELQNSVLFQYFAGSLYLLEKEFVHSY